MTGAEWVSRRDARLKLGVAEVLAMFGDWKFSGPEQVALKNIMQRLYAAASKAGPDPREGEQRIKAKVRREQRAVLVCKQSSPEEVARMRGDLMAPFGAGRGAKAVRS